MEPTPSILVFKTNIRSTEDIDSIKPFLDEHPHIQRWTVDTQDIDCVLRIVTCSLHVDEIIALVIPTGYACAELE
jgi:hypothetical protein